MNRFDWVQAKNAQDAAKSANSTAAQLTVFGKGSVSRETSIIKAGGIDLLDLMKEGVLSSSRVVNIRDLAGLKSAKYEAGKGMVIGPLMTLTEIEENKEIRQRYKCLSDAAGHVATPNIRNVATLGGNLLQRPRCWYFRSSDFHCLKKGGEHCFAIEGENKYHAVFDNQLCPIVHPSTMAVALTALGASIDIMSADGKTRTVKLESFWVAPEKDVHVENSLAASEMIVAIRLPDMKFQSAHIKLGEKDSYDWSIADCAVALEMNGSVCKKASIIIGAVAPVPWRAKQAESLLSGSLLSHKTINEELAHQAGKEAMLHAKPLSQNAYKVELGEIAVASTILAAIQQNG